MRFIAGFVIIGAFIVWLLFRLLIKKDLKQHTTALYTYGGFALVWGCIYWWIAS